MKNVPDQTIQQWKPLLDALSAPVLVMDEEYNLLIKTESACPALKGNLRPFIDRPFGMDRDGLNDNDVVVVIGDKKISGILSSIGDTKVLVLSDTLCHGGGRLDSAKCDKSDAGVGATDIIYTSDVMKLTVDLANRSSGIDATILLSGETGVGKTFLAKYIHNRSQRNRAPFVPINCGAIPIALLESELFGYEKGAFTGADRAGKAGLFEIAMGGTVFLDEIGEISKDIQVKILHAIEEKRIIRVGGLEPINLDIRLIAATNKDLSKMVNDGDFREDLYYRLNVISFTIPPLRDRGDDIVELARYYLQANNKKYNLNKELDTAVLDILIKYNWPGNVRELQNSVERMVVMSEGDVITERDIPPNITSFVKDRIFNSPEQERGILKNEKDMLERELIQQALSECKSIRKAAAKLGVSHVTLLRKMERLNLRSRN
ncbi:MAG: sigma 54-interacting transcriptional regulator [Clostridiales Family XIII bacterium]|jgi:transcriptional regulator with PAS, ATPase and Fis domain|nr:sigma 54-interacting transcriptional regulator [Clostridiales Family XIII bacterium]